MAGEGFISQNSNTKIIGLGSETIVDSLKVKWLSGTTDVFYNVAVNQTLEIVEGSSLSIDNQELSNNILIYPNPSSEGVFQLRFGNITLNEIESIKVVDSAGKTISTLEFNSVEQILDFSKFDDGVYFIKIKIRNSEVVKKIIKI